MCWSCFSRYRSISSLPLLVLLGALLAPCASAAPNTFIVIAYHDNVQKRLVADDFTPEQFVSQLTFFRMNGYHPVSIGDIEAAAAGGKPLPDKAILLTFDDAYLSFYKIVYPALKLFNYPAVLSVVTSWADGKNRPTDFYKTKRFMNWKQIREVAASGLVTIGGHSHDLHHLAESNPQGNVEPAMTTFIFDRKSGAYETEDAYRQRIRADMTEGLAAFEKNLGMRPVVFTWPYSAYNHIATEEARTSATGYF
jgi:biofilm PGA synthesis lipoprotein PgaB